MPQKTCVLAVIMKFKLVHAVLSVAAVAVAVSNAVPLSQANDHLHNSAKVPFIEKSPVPARLNLERPQLVDRVEPGSLKEPPPRSQLRPEAVFAGNRDNIQRPQIIYIKNSLAHDPNGRPQLPHVEGVRRRYRFDDIPDFRQGQWWNERPQISQEYERDMEQKKTFGEQTVSETSGKPILELPPPTKKPIEPTKPSRRRPSCLYSGRRYEHGQPVKIPEPCLNCTCQAGVLVCYLRVCPDVISVPEGCFAAREPGQCCATTICNNASNGETSNEVNSSDKTQGPENKDEDATEGSKMVMHKAVSVKASANTLTQPATNDGKQEDFLLDEQAVTLVPDESLMSRRLDSPLVVTSSPKLSSSSPPETSSKDLLAGACFSDDAWFMEGSAMISRIRCQYCYCLRGRKRCVRPTCALSMPGCKPQYGSPFDCCPTNYACQSTQPSRTTTTTTTDTTPAGACEQGGRSYELGAVLPSEACKTCVCTQKGIICTNVECPLAAVGCTGIIPEGHCCPTEYVCDKIRNKQNETEQLKIIPDPRPGSFKETHLFRKIDGDSFEAYLTTTAAAPKTSSEHDQAVRDNNQPKKASSSSIDETSISGKQVIVDTEGVNLTKDETANLFYVPETLLETSTVPAAISESVSKADAGAASTLPLVETQSIGSSEVQGKQKSSRTQTERAEPRGGSLDSIQNYLQPVYVPEDQVKTTDQAESLFREGNQGSTTMEDLKASSSSDSVDVLEPMAMASTTVSTFTAFPDTDTKLSKYSNNNGNSKKKSTFTVNLGSHITVAYDSAEVTTEDGITTAKNSEFGQLTENGDDPFWEARTTSTSATTTPTTTSELPRPSPHIFTLQEKHDHLTPTESSLKLTRKQGDDITTIPGLIISTPSSLLRADEPAKSEKPPSSSVPPYIITTSDIINNEVKFHPSRRPSSAETFSTEFGLRKTDVEPAVQSSAPSKSIYRTTTTAAGTATAASASAAATPSTPPTTTNAFDERTKKRAPQPEVGGSPLTNEQEELRKIPNAQRPAGNIGIAEGIKIFSTLILSGLAKTRSDLSTVSPTSATTPSLYYDSSVTEKFPASGQYSSPAPIPPAARNPLNGGRSTANPSAASSQFFASNIPLTYHANESPSKASKPQTSRTSSANRNPFDWQIFSNHHGERLANKSLNSQQSVLSFAAKDALVLPHGHFSATNQTISAKGSGCFINGVTIGDGEVIPKEDPCVLCRCYRGEELCTVRKCPSPPSEDCVQERLDGACCPRYTCKLDSVRQPARDSHRRIVDDGFHQPNHPKYVPHIDIMIASQNSQVGGRTVDRPNSKQEYIALEGVRRSPASSKRLFDHEGDKNRSGYPASTQRSRDQETRGGFKSSSSLAETDFTTIPTATLKVLLQHAASSLPTSTVTLAPTTEDKPFANTESPFARSLFKSLSDKHSAPHSNNVQFGSLSSSKNSPVLHDFVTGNQAQSASSSVWNLLKVSGCNIYGKYYRVNEVVTELTERCKVCTCTAIGVHCIHTC